MNLQNCTKQNFIRFCDHLCIFLMVKVAGICSETQGCPLCKETYPHLVYIMEYEHSTRTISPSMSTHPFSRQGLARAVPVSHSWEQSNGQFSSPSITSLSRKVRDQPECSKCRFVGTARLQDSCRNQSQMQFWVPAQGKCQYFRRSCEPGFACLCLF